MLGRMKSIGGPLRIVSGSFRPGVTGVKAAATKTITATNVFTFTAASAGTAGDALTVTMTDDGGTLDLSSVTTNIDTLVEVATPGTDITINIITAGSAIAAAGALYEDAVNNVATFVLRDNGVADSSTVTDFETLVAAGSLLAVHTAGTGANEFDDSTDVVFEETVPGTQHSATGSAAGIVIHFNDSTTTVAEVVADVAAISGAVITLAASGTTTNTLVAADAIAATAISALTSPTAGVDAVSAAESVDSEYISVAKSASPAGTYTVTVSNYEELGSLIAFGAVSKVATAEDVIPQMTSYSSGVLTISTLTTATETNVTDGAANTINWCMLFSGGTGSAAGVGRVLAEGKVAVVAGNVTKAGVQVGLGFSSSVASSHTYSIVLDRKYKNMICCLAGVMLATSADFDAQVISYTASTKTIVIKTIQAGSATALTAPGDSMHFIAFMEMY